MSGLIAGLLAPISMLLMGRHVVAYVTKRDDRRAERFVMSVVGWHSPLGTSGARLVQELYARRDTFKSSMRDRQSLTPRDVAVAARGLLRAGRIRVIDGQYHLA